VADGMQCEGPNERAEGYRVRETAYPPPSPKHAPLYMYVDTHFAIAMDEGMVSTQAKTLAALAMLLPDAP
jgi:hypothetical protein